MSFRLLSLKCCLCLAALTLAGRVVCQAQAGDNPPGRAMASSEPKSHEITTNLHALTSKRDGLKELEEDLYKPFESFRPDSSLDGVMSPPTAPPAGQVFQSKRLQAMMERRRDWIFLSAEDLTKGPTAEEILGLPEYGPDGQDKRTLSPLEKYFLRTQPGKGAKNTNQFVESESWSSDTGADQPEGRADTTDSKLPAGLSKSERELRKLLQSNRAADSFSHSAGTLSDIFGLARAEPSREEVLAHKACMVQFRQILDPGWQPPPDNDPVSALASILDPAPKAANTLNSLVGMTADPHTGLGLALPGLTPELTPKSSTLPSLTPSAPAAGPARVGPPPSPSFTAPRRQF